MTPAIEVIPVYQRDDHEWMAGTIGPWGSRHEAERDALRQYGEMIDQARSDLASERLAGAILVAVVGRLLILTSETLMSRPAQASRPWIQYMRAVHEMIMSALRIERQAE